MFRAVLRGPARVGLTRALRAGFRRGPSRALLLSLYNVLLHSILPHGPAAQVRSFHWYPAVRAVSNTLAHGSGASPNDTTITGSSVVGSDYSSSLSRHQHPSSGVTGPVISNTKPRPSLRTEYYHAGKPFLPGEARAFSPTAAPGHCCRGYYHQLPYDPRVYDHPYYYYGYDHDAGYPYAYQHYGGCCRVHGPMECCSRPAFYVPAPPRRLEMERGFGRGGGQGRERGCRRGEEVREEMEEDVSVGRGEGWGRGRGDGMGMGMRGGMGMGMRGGIGMGMRGGMGMGMRGGMGMGMRGGMGMGRGTGMSGRCCATDRPWWAEASDSFTSTSSSIQPQSQASTDASNPFPRPTLGFGFGPGPGTGHRRGQCRAQPQPDRPCNGRRRTLLQHPSSLLAQRKSLVLDMLDKLSRLPSSSTRTPLTYATNKLLAVINAEREVIDGLPPATEEQLASWLVHELPSTLQIRREEAARESEADKETQKEEEVLTCSKERADAMDWRLFAFWRDPAVEFESDPPDVEA